MAYKPAVPQTDIHVVRLVDQVSSKIDTFVDEFADRLNKDVGLGQSIGADYERTPHYQVKKRWHGADLWTVSKDSQASELSIVTRRVTIGAFSDAPDMLLFLPDIIVTTTNGKFMLPPDTPDWVEIENLRVSVSELARHLGIESSSRENVRHMLLEICSVAWSIAEDISPFEANVLVA